MAALQASSVPRRFCLVWMIAIVVVAGGCTKKSGPTAPKPVVPPLYGSLVTPQISLELDPLLSDAYQELGVDRCQIGHLAISWGSIELGTVARDWQTFDRHVQQARPRGLNLSVVLEFIHGGVADVPAYLWPSFPGWDDPDLFFDLIRFLHELQSHSLGTIRFLWLGEGPDRFAAANPGHDAAMIHFFTVVADSARRILPGAKIGTMITPDLLAADGGEALVRTLRDSLDVIGLSVFPEDQPGGLPDPQTALTKMLQTIAPWQGKPFAILEAGYPSSETLGSSPDRQSAFASALAQWLFDRPGTLELMCWSPVIDPDPSIIDSLSSRRYASVPADDPARLDFGNRLASMSLRRNDGTPKVGRQTWYDQRP